MKSAQTIQQDNPGACGGATPGQNNTLGALQSVPFGTKLPSLLRTYLNARDVQALHTEIVPGRLRAEVYTIGFDGYPDALRRPADTFYPQAIEYPCGRVITAKGTPLPNREAWQTRMRETSAVEKWRHV